MGIKKNVIYTSFLTTSNYIFPLIVYPYVARVLGVTNIGLCNFVDNLINYFILISMMGINIMGNRQVAAEKADRISLDRTYSKLFSLNAVTTSVALGILIGAIYIIPTLKENKELMWFGAIKLVSNFMLIEWFYKGLEDFKYITMRTIFVKCLYVASIFIFIHRAEDYPIYYLLTVLMVAVNAIINTFHARKFASFKFKYISFKGIVKPFFMLGTYMIVTSFCTTFNTVFLGFVTDDTQVGYYTTATKLYSILLAFFTGVTSVMLPRMSNLISQGKHEEFRNFLNSTSKLLIAFSIPVILVAVIFAPQIIYLIAGPGYEGAITPMRIIMPLMLIIGFEQILVIQGLMPLKADKAIMINSSIGAAVSITLNIILVKHLQCVGSAICWISSETTILILSQLAMYKLINIRLPWSNLAKTLIANIPLAAILIVIYEFIDPSFYWLFLGLATMTAIVYSLFIQSFLFKNPLVLNIFQTIKQKVAH